MVCVNNKICSKCGNTLSKSEFSKDINRKDGFKCWCKSCDSVYYFENRKNILSKIKLYNFDNREKIKKYQNKYRKNNKSRINPNKLAYKYRFANYKTFASRLTVDECPRLFEDGKSLEVLCKYCGRYFIPTNREIDSRINGLASVGVDNFLYCSSGCKSACSTYNQKKYPKGFKIITSRELQPELRKLVLERDNWECQKCFRDVEVVELHCHHILPLNESPIESADIDNCITLCKKHHKEVHKIPDCNFYELRCKEKMK